MTATLSALRIDSSNAVSRITAALRAQLASSLKRRGLVVGMSGGVDSSVCVALAVAAVGPKRVLGLFMPERESDPESLRIARSFAADLGIEHTTEDIAPILEATGCYRRRNEAIRSVVPEFTDDWGCKLVLPPDRLDADRLNITYLVVQQPGGTMHRVRLPAAEYRQIVAASNFKQRVRAMLEYYHADRLHYAVVGTPNRLEYDQGFFVKGGDGLADVKPIAHLYKSQVYQLAGYLGVPVSVTSRPPTTDTFSLPQSQEEFYYNMPTQTLDIVLHARNEGRAADDVSQEIGFTVEQVERAYADIDQKRMTTRYLHLGPQLVEPVVTSSSPGPV
ncbi:MAG: NAD(+) synthase [Gemmatimonadetes bacterium]|nr:MAG: NAD(+) synthase [Gemmatimonadota bacterium]